MPRPGRLAAILIGALLPAAALAHPHVFIDVSLTLRYDAQGRLSAVDEAWAYDELYSLLMLSETGAGDSLGLPQLQAWDALDANWDPLNGGRLELQTAGGRIASDPPRPLSTRLEGNRMVSRRSHTLPGPIAGEVPTAIRIYDPTFYVAFSLPSQVVIQGRADCQVTRQSGNVQAQTDAYASALRDALARELGRTSSDDVQVQIGAVGAASLEVRCGG
ncbi:DUF1007 family protein [Paracoccus gahaiensis]|uniref:DUF1007 family protein n=1 Tax=Paracoccus gahaiensis TaxID=1706839 RepID=A0A4U0R8V7_9RHOB|nr:DUF1007 family protein [Paracoccus gahaiensis]TJZ91417.1 DUF1007 family protein [Paracoccus gahaiensis]